MKKGILFACLSAVAVLHAQTVNLKGKVLTKSGTPVPQAIVQLAGQGLKDTTDNSGAFSLEKNVVGISYAKGHGLEISMRNNMLLLSLHQAGSVAIDVYNLLGKNIKSEKIPNLQAGSHQVRLDGLNWESDVLLIRVRIGDQVLSLRPQALALRGNSAGALDTLITSADGYITDSLAIPAFEATHEIVLDSVKTVAFTGSAGCGKAATFTNGTKSITSAGKARQYIVELPANYDSNHPYRLIFVLHAMYGNMTETANGKSVPGNGIWAFNGLKGKAENSAIFVSPQGLGNPAGWGEGDADLAFFDDMLKAAKEGSCVDTTRIFSTGFSFGGAMTHVLAARRPNVFRAVVVQDGGTMSGDPAATGKIAYMGVHGDNTSNFVPPSWGRSIRDKFVVKNGCAANQTPPEAAVGSRSHTCYDYTGCDAAYPVKWCTFDGTHHSAPYDGPLVNNNEDDGAKTWVPAVAWAFLSQF